MFVKSCLAMYVLISLLKILENQENLDIIRNNLSKCNFNNLDIFVKFNREVED